MMYFFQDWEFYAGLIALCSFLMVVLLDMAARAFSLQSLSMWVKAEYAQVAVSFLILLFAIAMVTAGNDVMTSVTRSMASSLGNAPLTDIAADYSGNPFKIAKEYISQVLVGCESRLYYTIYSLNVMIAPLGTAGLEIAGFEVVSGRWVLSGPISTFAYVNNTIVQLSVFHYAMYYLLTFSQYTMVQIFLPIGLLLRAFPLTRGAGGLLTAIALSFAFVLPLTYLLILAVMPSNDSICQSLKINTADAETPCYNNRGEIVSKIYEMRGRQGDINKQAEDAVSYVSIMYLQALFYPLVCLIFVFTFIRQTSSLFGADLAEIGRGLVKIM